MQPFRKSIARSVLGAGRPLKLLRQTPPPPNGRRVRDNHTKSSNDHLVSGLRRGIVDPDLKHRKAALQFLGAAAAPSSVANWVSTDHRLRWRSQMSAVGRRLAAYKYSPNGISCSWPTVLRRVDLKEQVPGSLVRAATDGGSHWSPLIHTCSGRPHRYGPRACVGVMDDFIPV